MAARRQAPQPGQAAYAVMILGSATLLISAFLPQHSARDGLRPTVGSLLTEGTGWGFLVGGILVVALTRRALTRRRFSWSGLWIGGLAVLNAAAMAADHTFHPIGPGIGALGVGGVVVLAGWGVLFAIERPEIAGVGRVSALVRPLPPGRAPQALTPASTRRGPLRRSPVLWSLPLYAVLSFLFWGVPVIGHFHTTLIAGNDIDPAQYTWFYSWWPHAVFNGHNPFLTTALLAPDGYNLTWATAVPGPSLLASPITALFGAVVTYNVLTLAAPAVAAWTAFLLCRHLTGRTLPSLAGGYIFGFSPYMLQMVQGSPDLFFVALVPVLVLLVIRYLEGSLGSRKFVVAAAVTVALQFVTTVELVATSAIFGSVALAAGFAFCPERRPTIVRTVGLLAVASVGAAVLVSPVLYFMLFYGHTTPYNNGPLLANDLLSWIYPGPVQAVATTHQFIGTPGYFGGPAYFTAPLLMLVAIWIWERRRDWAGRVLSACFIVPAVFSLGSLLRFHDHFIEIGLPWSDLAHFPGLKLLIPQRFTMYAFLAAAVIVATLLSSPVVAFAGARERVRMWLTWASGAGAVRWALVAAAAVLMVPDVGNPAFKTPISDPPFFTGTGYRAYLRPSDRVITIPIIGESMRWQADAHFGFEIAGGGLGTYPPGYLRYPTFLTLLSGQLTPGYGAQLRRFVHDKGVTAAVIAGPQIGPPWVKLFASLGVRPVKTGGVLFYRISGTNPGTATAG